MGEGVSYSSMEQRHPPPLHHRQARCVFHVPGSWGQPLPHRPPALWPQGCLQVPFPNQRPLEQASLLSLGPPNTTVSPHGTSPHTPPFRSLSASTLRNRTGQREGLERKPSWGLGPTDLADAILWSSSRETENSEPWWKTSGLGPDRRSTGFAGRLYCCSHRVSPGGVPQPQAAPSLEVWGAGEASVHGERGKASEAHNCLGEGTREIYTLQQGFRRSHPEAQRGDETA